MSLWGEYDDLYLRDNWGKIPASTIGRHLDGRSKNSVVGRAHRLGLPRLVASPVPFDGPEDRAQRRRRKWKEYRAAKKAGLTRPKPIPAGVVTLEALGSLRAIAHIPRTYEAIIVPFVPRPPKRTTAPVLSKSPCCWPEGDPKKPGFRFCEKPAELGRSYCPKHSKLAYQPGKRAREEA